jgi:hypothetical protein
VTRIDGIFHEDPRMLDVRTLTDDEADLAAAAVRAAR